MHNKHIRTIICDDHAGIREVIASFLATHPHITIVASCNTGEEALQKCQELVPDILLVDIHMPETDGFEVVRRLTETGLPTKAIGVSVASNQGYANLLIKLGAKGYMSKTSPPDEFLKAIDAVLRDKIYIAEEITNREQ